MSVLNIRVGRKLSSQQAEIFDALPEDLDGLCVIASRNCIKVQIHQINGLLRETDWAICSDGRRPPTYRVVNVRAIANDNRREVKRAA